MTRIEAPAAAGGHIRWGAAVAVPSMIAAAFVAALYMLADPEGPAHREMTRGPASVPPVPSASRARTERAPHLERQLAKAEAGRHSVRTATPLRQPRRAAERQVQTVVAEQDAESSIPVRERPEPIAIAAISPSPVEVRAMDAVAELTIAPLAVDPLAVPDPNQP